MKSTLLRLIALLVLLLCVLVPSCAGAITGRELMALRGERSYPQALDLPDAQTMAVDRSVSRSGDDAVPKPDRDEIRRLTEQYAGQMTDLGSAVDFLTVFTDDYAGALVNQANHLQSMYLIAEESLSDADKTLVGGFIEQYSQIASSLYSEVEFLTTKLSYAYERIDVLIRLIQSGEYAPAEIDAYVAELSSVAGEAEERLNAFLTDEDYLYKYFYSFMEASMMISGMTEGMNLQLDKLHEAFDKVIEAEAQKLYEKENSGSLLRAASTNIAVVARSRYVIVARDTNGNPVVNADVKVRVLDGKSKTVSTIDGKTDSYGYLILCFADFRPGSDNQATIDVLIHADGFRTQASGKRYVQGGGFTEMRMEKDDGTPYLIQTAYNDEDIVHEANSIYTSTYNTAKQNLKFMVNTKIPCKVQLYQPESGKENIIAEFSVNPSKPDSSLGQDATFKSEFTRTCSDAYASEAFFKRKLPVYTRIIWNQDGKEQKRDTLTLFSIKRGRVPNPVTANNPNVFMNKVGFQLPKDWPVIGGTNLNIPVNTEKSNFFFYLGLDGTLYAGVSKTIKSAKHSWQNETEKTQKKIERSIAATDTSRREAFAAGIAQSYELMQKEHVAAGYTASITPYLYLIARLSSIDTEEEIVKNGWNEFQGGITVGAIATFNASATFQAVVGPFPVFLSLDFGMGLNFGLHFGIKFDMKGALEGFRDFRFDDNTGAFLAPYLRVSITVGLGIPRLAYVGVQGMAYAEADILFAPLFHLQKAKARAAVSLEFCIFFISKSYTLWSVEATYPTNRMQQAVLLSSMAEGLEDARAQSDARPAAAKPNDPQADRIEKATMRSGQYFWNRENIDIRFVPISMKHPFYLNGMPIDAQDDRCLALWLQKDKGSSRQRIYYTSTQLNTSNDLIIGSREEYCIELNREYDNWSVVDFDVDYFCRVDSPQNPKLYFAITIAPMGTDNSKIATEARLLYLECDVIVAKRAGKIEPRIWALTGMLLSPSDPQPGFIMPRIERTPDGLAAGAIATYPASHGQSRRAVMLWHIREDESRSQTQTVAQWLDQNPGDGWEVAEFEVFDQLLYNAEAPGSNRPGYALLMRSTTDESQSMFYMYPGPSKGGMAGIIQPYSFGGSKMPNFSNFNMIEEYDELYNARQIGIAALRLQKDEVNQTLSTNLFLMSLNRSKDCIQRWLGLNPTDTGVTVGADGFRFLEINGSHYAYWLTSAANSNGSMDYEIQACYINLKHGVASRPFTLLKLDSRSPYVDKETIFRVALLPITRGSRNLLYGVLSGKYQINYWEKFTYGLQMSMEVTALVKESPVILPGDTFTSRIVVRNTGMMPIYNFSIDYLTRPKDTAASSNVFVKQIAVDMQDVKNNEVRNVNGKTGEATSTALKGEAAVYRMDDGSRERNGEIAHIKRYRTNNGHNTSQSLDNGYREETVEVASLPADGKLDLKTVFTAPLNCWGDVEKEPNVILTALVHNLEAGIELEPQADSSSYSLERDGAVTLNAPLSARSDKARTAEPDPNFGEKLTLPVEAVYYAPYDNSGQERIDTADFGMDANNLILEADVRMVSGVPTVQITLRNLNGTQADDVVPMLVAMVDGKETWRKSLKTGLDNNFTRSLSVPLAELAGGKPYSSIDLRLVSISKKRSFTAESIDYSVFNEANEFDNQISLSAVYDFYFRTEPQSTTAFVGEDVTLTAEAAGESGPFTYQWYELAPDGTQRTLRGETGTSLTLEKLTLSSDNTKYLCTATNNQGVVLYSQVATLTISEELPATGDASHLNGWMALLAVCGVVLLALAARRQKG